jgi:hypothetical protein
MENIMKLSETLKLMIPAYKVDFSGLDLREFGLSVKTHTETGEITYLRIENVFKTEGLCISLDYTRPDGSRRYRVRYDDPYFNHMNELNSVTDNMDEAIEILIEHLESKGL